MTEIIEKYAHTVEKETDIEDDTLRQQVQEGKKTLEEAKKEIAFRSASGYIP